MTFNIESFDIRSDCEVVFEFELIHPANGEPLGAYISIVGAESERGRLLDEKFERQDANRVTQALRRNAVIPTMSKKDQEARAIEKAVVYTVGWRGFQGKGGVELEFNVDNARTLFDRHPWIPVKVIEMARDLGNFVRTPSANSSSTPATSSASA